MDHGSSEAPHLFWFRGRDAMLAFVMVSPDPASPALPARRSTGRRCPTFCASRAIRSARSPPSPRDEAYPRWLVTTEKVVLSSAGGGARLFEQGLPATTWALVRRWAPGGADTVRKLIHTMNATLDGYIAAPGDDIGWSVPSAELHPWFNDRAGELGVSRTAAGCGS